MSLYDVTVSGEKTTQAYKIRVESWAGGASEAGRKGLTTFIEHGHAGPPYNKALSVKVEETDD